MGPTTTTLLLVSAAALLLNLLPAARSDAVHDLVVSFGLPPGILPDNVVSNTLNPDTGEFTIELASECYIHFSRLVYFEKHLSGKVSPGKLTDLNGIQAKELFFWFSLSGIVVKPEKGVIEFQSGILSEELPAAEFYTIHECKSGVAGHRGADGVLGAEKKASAAVAAVAEAGAVAAEQACYLTSLSWHSTTLGGFESGCKCLLNSLVWLSQFLIIILSGPHFLRKLLI